MVAIIFSLTILRHSPLQPLPLFAAYPTNLSSMFDDCQTLLTNQEENVYEQWRS